MSDERIKKPHDFRSPRAVHEEIRRRGKTVTVTFDGAVYRVRDGRFVNDTYNTVGVYTPDVLVYDLAEDMRATKEAT